MMYQNTNEQVFLGDVGALNNPDLKKNAKVNFPMEFTFDKSSMILNVRVCWKGLKGYASEIS